MTVVVMNSFSLCVQLVCVFFSVSLPNDCLLHDRLLLWAWIKDPFGQLGSEVSQSVAFIFRVG